jgi:hypothetical protein
MGGVAGGGIDDVADFGFVEVAGSVGRALTMFTC